MSKTSSNPYKGGAKPLKDYGWGWRAKAFGSSTCKAIASRLEKLAGDDMDNLRKVITAELSKASWRKGMKGSNLIR